MLRLALRTLRFRLSGFIASFVALFLGATIVMVCGGLLETGIRADVPPHRLTAAGIVVTANQVYQENVLAEWVRLDGGLVPAVLHVPGVAGAVGERSVPVGVLRGSRPVAGVTTGYGWSSSRLGTDRLGAGAAPAAADQVVLDAGLAQQTGARVGDEIQLVAGGVSRTFRLTGISAGVSGTPPAVFFTDDEAAALSPQPHMVNDIGVLAAPGVDIADLARRVQAALPAGARVLTGDDRGLAEFPAASGQSGNLIPLSGVFGGLSIMVTMFIVASTLGLSVQLRQREMALLRAIGSTPRQLRRMIVGETLIIAVPAALLGYLPSSGLGRWLLGQVAANGVAPVGIVYHQSWIPTVSAVGIGLVTALAAALIAARSATRVRPVEALTDASLQTRWLSWPRVLFAVLCLGGALALALVTGLVMSGPVASSTATPSAMLWAAGLALLGPGLTGMLAMVVRWPLRALGGNAAYLATLNAPARRVRLAGAVVPVMLATGLATALIYLQTIQATAADHAVQQTVRADAVVTSMTGGMPIGLVDTVATLPGVAGASAVVSSTGFFDQPVSPSGDSGSQYVDSVPLQGISAAGAAQTMAFPVTAGSLADLTGDTVALATAYARPGRNLGDTVAMRLGDNSVVRPRIVALFNATRGYQSVLLPAPLLVAHTATDLVPRILVTAAPGTDPATLAHTIETLAGAQPGLAVATSSSISAAGQEPTGVWVNYLLVAAIVAYTVISLVNSIIVSTVVRRREFALQRLIGSTRGQVLRMMGVEAIVVAVVGVVLGTAIALATLVPFSIAAMNRVVPAGQSAGTYLLIVLAAVGLTLLTTVIPTAVALRSPAADAATSGS